MRTYSGSQNSFWAVYTAVEETVSNILTGNHIYDSYLQILSALWKVP